MDIVAVHGEPKPAARPQRRRVKIERELSLDWTREVVWLPDGHKRSTKP